MHKYEVYWIIFKYFCYWQHIWHWVAHVLAFKPIWKWFGQNPKVHSQASMQRVRGGRRPWHFAKHVFNSLCNLQPFLLVTIFLWQMKELKASRISFQIMDKPIWKFSLKDLPGRLIHIWLKYYWYMADIWLTDIWLI